VSASKKLPAFQFYVGDWRKDIGVQGLDFEHRGVWLEVLCLMHESPERGRLVLPSGDPLPDEAIARNLSITEAEWKQKRSKLLAYGVASQDEDGVLYNRRMVRDEDIRNKRAEAGRKGGKVSKPPSKEEANGGSSVSASSSPSVKKRALPDYSDDFEAVWKTHPRGSKKKAWPEYRKAVPKRIDHDSLLSALKSYVRSELQDDFKGVHLERWIRDDRWEEQQTKRNGVRKPSIYADRHNPTPWIPEDAR
jgi:hypothetical protein